VNSRDLKYFDFSAGSFRVRWNAGHSPYSSPPHSLTSPPGILVLYLSKVAYIGTFIKEGWNRAKSFLDWPLYQPLPPALDCRPIQTGTTSFLHVQKTALRCGSFFSTADGLFFSGLVRKWRCRDNCALLATRLLAANSVLRILGWLYLIRNLRFCLASLWRLQRLQRYCAR